MTYANVYYPAFDAVDGNDGFCPTTNTDSLADVISFPSFGTYTTTTLHGYDDYAAAPVGSVVSEIKGYPTWEKVSLNCWTDGLRKRSDFQMSRHTMILDYWADNDYTLLAA